MRYTFISGDCHVDLTWLPADLFTSHAPAALKDKVPQVVETARGKRWQAEGADLGQVAGVGSSGRDPKDLKDDARVQRMAQTGLYDDGAKGVFRPTTPELRIKDQQLDGIEAEVLYGILGVADKLKSPEAATLVLQTYNDWLANFCKTHPERFAGVACLPNHDPKAAAEEAHRTAKLGLRGGELVIPNAGKPLYHKEWDVLWQAASDSSMPVSFHSMGIRVRAPEPAEAQRYNLEYNAVNSTMFEIAGAEYLASIIFSGACDRFPAFRFVLGECGVAWIPYVLGHMDRHYTERYHALKLSAMPSEIWRRQGYTGFQWEPHVAPFAHLAGIDTIIWGSDFPHQAGLWPDSKKILGEILTGLSEDERRKITCDNAGKLYRFIT